MNSPQMSVLELVCRCIGKAQGIGVGIETEAQRCLPYFAPRTRPQTLFLISPVT